METPHTTPETTRTERKGVNYAAAALWASAFILGALTIVQAGRLPGSEAYAGAANASIDGSSVVTVPTGLGPDNKPYEALWVLDGRSEMLSIYYIENASAGDKSLLLRNMVSLPELFMQARGGK
ncbi:MAG: hypothetical protein JNK53_06960 [Phycisphaerae bacterium]|nr:hypothetical protein [Phycisphaerae bacterium]